MMLWEGTGWGDHQIDHEALRGSGYISQGSPQHVTPSFEPVLSDLCQLVRKKKNG